MAVLVTGGTGFIGLNVAEALLARGRRVVLFAPEDMPAPFRRTGCFDEAAFVAGDVRARDELARALAAHDVREIVHLAALTPSPGREAAEPEPIFEVNVLGTVAAMRAAAAHGAIRRVLVLSSVAVYGSAAPGADGRLREDGTCPRPQGLYGISKLAAEQAALRLGALHGIDTRVVRLGPAFGPWERRSGTRDLPSPHCQVIDLIAARRPVVLPRPIAADWLYARDAGAGIAAVLDADELPERCVNLGGERVTTVAEWCEELRRSGVAAEWRLAADREEATVAIGLAEDRPPLSNARLRAATGFRHRYGLAEAARDHLAWLGAHGPDLQDAAR